MAPQCTKCGKKSSGDLTLGHCLSCLDVLIHSQGISQAVSDDVDESGYPNKQVTLYQNPLYSKLKTHQKEGFQFIWKNCFADWQKVGDTEGGCILAHYMGLGK